MKQKYVSSLIVVGHQEYYVDGYMQSILSLAIKAIRNDWDMIFVVDGFEGTGKSVMAQQAAYYCDNTFNIDRIVFNPKDFIEAIKKAKKYQAIVYDEAFGGMMARRSMNYVNIVLMKMLAEIRQKNLFVFIVLPCFFELDKYAAMWRSRGLIHVYDHKFKRGRFSFYNRKAKKRLYLEGKKGYSYRTSPSFFGRFTNHYTVDEKAYRAKKLESLLQSDKKREVDRSGREGKWLITLINDLKDYDGMKLKHIAGKIGISYRTMHRFLKDSEKNDMTR